MAFDSPRVSSSGGARNEKMTSPPLQVHCNPALLMRRSLSPKPEKTLNAISSGLICDIVLISYLTSP